MTSPKWSTEESVSPNLETDNQRKARARAFKLKKWITNIERQSKKSLEMERTLESYYNELNELQEQRAFNKSPVTNKTRADIQTREEHRGYR